MSLLTSREQYHRSFLNDDIGAAGTSYALPTSSLCTMVLKVRLILPAGSRLRLGTACIQ